MHPDQTQTPPRRVLEYFLHQDSTETTHRRVWHYANCNLKYAEENMHLDYTKTETKQHQDASWSRIHGVLEHSSYCTKTTLVWVHGKTRFHQDGRLGGILVYLLPDSTQIYSGNSMCKGPCRINGHIVCGGRNDYFKASVCKINRTSVFLM